MAKKQQVVRDGNIVKVNYPTIGKSVSCDLDRLPENIKFLGLAHGIGQKLGDAASGKSPAEKYEMASRIVEALYAGEWELTATRDDTEIIVLAVSLIKGVPTENVHEALEELDDEKRDEKVKEWRTNLKVKAQIAQLRAERAAEAAAEADDLEI